jgi:maleylacetate reductase
VNAIDRAVTCRQNFVRANFARRITLALFRLALRLGAPGALRDLGMPQDVLDQAADLAVRNAYANPRPIERTEIRAMLARAWSGDSPADWGFGATAH